MTNKIAIGSDHAGFSRKEELISYLESKGVNVLNKGCFSEERADYPDYAHAVAKAVLSKQADSGILLCGSGNGIAMSANKHQGIRAALCWNSEIAVLARQHNDANILVLPARFITKEEALRCCEVFLSTGFEGGRHLDRIKKIDL
jgi:ribose 5-phosphate isomerase B